MLRRRPDARARLDFGAGIAQRHLGTGQSLKDHDLVEPAEMADAEQLARDFGKTDAQRQL